jgi:hypothetical protein
MPLKKYKFKLALVLIALNPALSLQAQTLKAPPSITATKITEAVVINGKLDENFWQQESPAADFVQNYPTDTAFAETKTAVMLAYDDDFLYISATCYDDLEGDYIVQSLKRDFNININDAFSVFIDPFNDKVNGFYFAVSPLGVQSEGLLEGGPRDVSLVWDNKWFSAVETGPNYWTVEIAIPFKTLRYKEGVDNWGINFSRHDLKRPEVSSWAPVPRNFTPAALQFAGDLNFSQAPKKAGASVALIPYAITNAAQNYEEGADAEFGANFGGDAKVAVSSSLNLDLTVNPDFSQVEVDQQQVNLTRFSLFFPERRQFFVENSDLFGQFGFSKIRPFFSRNIGLDAGQIIPILGGARLSGKLNPKLRIGLMNIQTAQDTSLGVEAQNYTVAAFQQKVFGESFIGGILVNRQGFDDESIDENDYNRIVGGDFNLVTKSNKLRGKVFYHHALTPEKQNDNFAHASWLMLSTRHVFAMWNHEYVGENYDAEVGFVPRNKQYNPITDSVETRAYWRIEPLFFYNFTPASGPVVIHGPGINADFFANKDYDLTDIELRPAYKVGFRNTTEIEVGYSYTFTRLFFDTDVTFSGLDLIPAGDYEYTSFSFSYSSDVRKKLNGSASFQHGSYYNGTRSTVRGNLSFRKQPWGIFGMAFSQNIIELPEPFEAATITLVGPKIELSFTKTLFWTTFLQYNTQADNFNINTRFQWRFRPMSDLYFVYTDNYDPLNIAIKNRAVVLKLIYWLNL